MVNATRKQTDLSMEFLQELAKKYIITKSGSKKAIAKRLWDLERHVMTPIHLKKIEDYLKIATAKRYKGPRYYTRKNGSLTCASGPCDQK